MEVFGRKLCLIGNSWEVEIENLLKLYYYCLKKKWLVTMVRPTLTNEIFFLNFDKKNAYGQKKLKHLIQPLIRIIIIIIIL